MRTSGSFHTLLAFRRRESGGPRRRYLGADAGQSLCLFERRASHDGREDEDAACGPGLRALLDGVRKSGELPAMLVALNAGHAMVIGTEPRFVRVRQG